MAENSIVVVGSINMDLVADAPRLPAPGETILGTAFRTTPGGKGANQAIAAARAGAAVAFVGAVGDDTFALELRQTLVDAEVDTERLREVASPSGVAAITVDRDGQNSIVVVAGANSRLSPLTDDDVRVVADADVLLCQLEIPLATVTAAARAAAGSGTTVVLNPSPVQPLPRELLESVDVLVVNETEEGQLGESTLDAVPHVVTTLGAAGARYRGPGGVRLSVESPGRRRGRHHRCGGRVRRGTGLRVGAGSAGGARLRVRGGRAGRHPAGRECRVAHAPRDRRPAVGAGVSRLDLSGPSGTMEA